MIMLLAAAFIAMRASMKQTGNMITGYQNVMDPELFLKHLVTSVVVGGILIFTFSNLYTILNLCGCIFSLALGVSSAVYALAILAGNLDGNLDGNVMMETFMALFVLCTISWLGICHFAFGKNLLYL